jgi:hypothetical protein
MTAKYPGEKDVPCIAGKGSPESNLLSVIHRPIRATETSRETFFPPRLSEEECILLQKYSKKLGKRILFSEASSSFFASGFPMGLYIQ